MTLEEVTTLKEAIKRLKEVIKGLRSTIQPFLYDDEAKDYILKALEQEPCEDCISRKHLLEEIALLKESPWFKDNTNCAMAIRKETIEIVEDLCIRKEPSVNPQEPCEDAISRQAVIELCEGWWLGHTKEDDFATEIRNLPSVNPQKIGHWIKTGYIDKVTCSICKRKMWNFWEVNDFNYCPNCGSYNGGD